MQKFLVVLKKLLVAAIIAAVLGGVIFYFAQGFLEFPGRGLYAGNASEWERRVTALGSKGYIPAEFSTGDGRSVKGIWAPCAPGAAPALLWLHSRGQTTTEINQDLKPLTDAGFHVFAMEFRGYGVTPGETTEATLLSDGTAAFDWMTKRDDVVGGRVFVGGVDLGANVAVKVASRRPATGLVLVSPLPDMATAVASKIPVIPLGFLIREKFDIHPDLAAVACPAFIAHGTEDGVVSIERVEEIVSRLGGSARLREIPGAGHENVLERGGKELSDEIDVFKDRPR